jgi:hypothetical protein
MKARFKNLLAGALGVTLVLISICLYFQNSHFWFFFGAIGAWLSLDSLLYMRNGNSTLGLIYKGHYKTFSKYYLDMWLLGMVIESWAYYFELWDYKLYTLIVSGKLEISSFSLFFLIAIGFFIYPFILMHFKEMFALINSYLKSWFASLILSVVIGILIWEIPNTYSYDWKYTIDVIDYEIFNVNVFIIFAWIILIALPVVMFQYRTRNLRPSVNARVISYEDIQLD